MFNMHNLQPFAFFNDPFAFYEAPETEGDGQPNPETDNGDGAGAGEEDSSTSTDEKVYTKAEFEAAFGPRAKRAEETAVKSLLTKLKFEKPEDLEAFLTEARQKADAELSEVERLKKQLEDAPAAERLTTLEAENEAQNKVIAGLVEGLIKDLNIPKHIVALFEGLAPTQQLEYINTNRDAFKATPAPPNLNGADKGGTKKSELKKKRQDSVKSRIPALSRRR